MYTGYKMLVCCQVKTLPLPNVERVQRVTVVLGPAEIGPYVRVPSESTLAIKLSLSTLPFPEIERPWLFVSVSKILLT